MSPGAAGRLAAAAELGVDPAVLGAMLDASTPTARDALRRTVLERERALAGQRSTSRRTLWPALVAGRWRLIDAFTAAGTRYVVACENTPGAPRALHPRERRVVELVLEGRSGKWIAYELALSESTVTRTLHAALRKLGVTDTAALAGIRTAVFEPLGGAVPGQAIAIARHRLALHSLASLSTAERAIVRDILCGGRSAAIACARGTSSRTVRHQIASIYKKLEVSSRAELLALLV